MCKNWRKVVSWKESKEKKKNCTRMVEALYRWMRWITHQQKYYDKFVEPIVALEMKKKMWEEEGNSGRIIKKNNGKQTYEKKQ